MPQSLGWMLNSKGKAKEGKKATAEDKEQQYFSKDATEIGYSSLSVTSWKRRNPILYLFLYLKFLQEAVNRV